jgi:hypothetical protein
MWNCGFFSTPLNKVHINDFLSADPCQQKIEVYLAYTFKSGVHFRAMSSELVLGVSYRKDPR